MLLATAMPPSKSVLHLAAPPISGWSVPFFSIFAIQDLKFGTLARLAQNGGVADSLDEAKAAFRAGGVRYRRKRTHSAPP